MGNNVQRCWAAAQRRRETLERLQRRVYVQRMDKKQQQIIKHRQQVLLFWQTHGLAATKDAFRVSRRTLFRWQKDPTPKSRAHRHGYVRRVIPPVLVTEICRQRTIHPRLGKEKLTPLLREFCLEAGLPVITEPTVGRMIAQLKATGKLPTNIQLRMSAKTGKLLAKPIPPKRKKLRRGDYRPEQPGGLLQLDGVLVFVNGQRRYTFTAVCVVAHWSFSKTYTSASSRNGADFLRCLLEAAATDDLTITHIQTDNGSEFMKEFGRAVEEAKLTHFFNWVKQPKYQGWVERFNRTIQEEFLNWHRQDLAMPPDLFNPILAEWTTWYNTKRVHRSLGKPGHRLTPMQYLKLNAECQTG